MLFWDDRSGAPQTVDLGAIQPGRFRRVSRGRQGSNGLRSLCREGGKHADAKPLKGFGGGGVVEIIRNHKGDTFRVVYTVRLADAVYVLHAFQKKSKTGRETPKADVDMIERRMREAERISEGERR